MKSSKTLFICFLLNFLIHPVEAQLYERNPVTYMDGAAYASMAYIQIPKANPALGISLGFESGMDHIKFAVGLVGTPVRAKAGTLYEKAYSIGGEPDIMVPCDTRSGFTSMGLNVRYYIFSTEETVGSNFYGGLGFGMHMLTRKIFAGTYNESLYKLENNFLDAFGTEIKRENGIGAVN